MADRSERLVSLHLLQVHWAGEDRMVEVMQLEGRPLVGNSFLYGNLIQIELEEGGGVQIEPL